MVNVRSVSKLPSDLPELETAQALGQSAETEETKEGVRARDDVDDRLKTGNNRENENIMNEIISQPPSVEIDHGEIGTFEKEEEDVKTAVETIVTETETANKIEDLVKSPVIARALCTLSADELAVIPELTEFALNFRARRTALGLQQHEIAQYITETYGYATSQTTVSRFEALTLHWTNARKVVPLFKRIIADFEDLIKSGKPIIIGSKAFHYVIQVLNINRGNLNAPISSIDGNTIDGNINCNTSVLRPFAITTTAVSELELSRRGQTQDTQSIDNRIDMAAADLNIVSGSLTDNVANDDDFLTQKTINSLFADADRLSLAKPTVNNSGDCAEIQRKSQKLSTNNTTAAAFEGTAEEELIEDRSTPEPENKMHNKVYKTRGRAKRAGEPLTKDFGHEMGRGKGEEFSLERKRPRRTRTILSLKQTSYLESQFEAVKHPRPEELDIISEETGLETEVVRVWFANRRQKANREATTARRMESDLVKAATNIFKAYVEPIQIQHHKQITGRLPAVRRTPRLASQPRKHAKTSIPQATTSQDPVPSALNTYDPQPSAIRSKQRRLKTPKSLRYASREENQTQRDMDKELQECYAEFFQ